MPGPHIIKMRITFHIKSSFRMLHTCDFGSRISQRLDNGQKCTRYLTVFYVKMHRMLVPVWLLCFLHVIVTVSVLARSFYFFFCFVLSE